MAIVTLLGVGLIFKALGWTDLTGKITALTIGTIVCIAASIAGDISQDLKTGFILGATPRKQQISELLGAVGSAFSILIMLFKIPPLPFAVGIYLPLNTMTPVFIGGLIRHMVDSRAKARDDAEGKISDSGVLLSSGFIAGEGLLGVVIAIIAVIMTQQPRFLVVNYPYEWMGQAVSAIAFSLLGWYLFKVALKSRQAGSQEK